MSQGPVSPVGVQTKVQIVWCTTENNIILNGFLCAQICGSGDEGGGGDKTGKEAWLAQTLLPNPALGFRFK